MTGGGGKGAAAAPLAVPGEPAPVLCWPGAPPRYLVFPGAGRRALVPGPRPMPRGDAQRRRSRAASRASSPGLAGGEITVYACPARASCAANT